MHDSLIYDLNGWGGSRGVGFERSDGLVSGFEIEALLYFVVQELGVLHQVLVACDAGVACFLDCLDAVPDAVAAANTFQGAGKSAVPQSLSAVLHGFAGVSAFALNADGGAEGPAAGVTVEAGKTAGLIGVPDVDAGCDVAGGLVEAEAGEDFIHVDLNYDKTYLI